MVINHGAAIFSWSTLNVVSSPDPMATHTDKTTLHMATTVPMIASGKQILLGFERILLNLPPTGLGSLARGGRLVELC